jgi:hypothetical protein
MMRLKAAALAEQKTAPAIVNSDHWLSMEVEREVDALWVRWFQSGSFEGEYVWFKRGSVRIAVDRPDDGYELAFGERVPSNKEKTALYDWVHRKLRVVPCLPEEP